MTEYERRADEFAEKHGIIDYSVDGKIMKYYRKHKTDCFGHFETVKHIVNLSTMQERVVILKRNRKHVEQ